ncbi:MAG: indolepyruvate oxidoreductase subunit IorB (IOR) [Acidobacteria bacterium]|nr:indolepyruvate oxidoreductase subunit IorB (IOR) [Acidobacteriota bacterium]
MKRDVVLAGVGGQGVLSVAAILAEAARREGLVVRQGEVHGMSQRGGAVQASLRLADGPIEGDLVARGGADLVLGVEPVEALRYLEYLAPGGRLVTAADPYENVPDYPPIEEVLAAVRAVPGSVLVEAGALAREAGSGRVANVVMVGAASAFLPISRGVIEACLQEGFAAKGERVVEANLRAFALGRAAVSKGGDG